MAHRGHVILTESEKNQLEGFTRNGVHSTHLLKRAQTVLELDTSDGRKPKRRDEIAQKVGLSPTAVTNIKNDWLSREGVDSFLQRRKRATPPVDPKITGAVQAHVIALACTEPPEGYARWTLTLLAKKSVELGFVDSISNVSVGTVLKKIDFSLTDPSTGAFRLSRTPNS